MRSYKEQKDQMRTKRKRSYVSQSKASAETPDDTPILSSGVQKLRENKFFPPFTLFCGESLQQFYNLDCQG